MPRSPGHILRSLVLLPWCGCICLSGAVRAGGAAAPAPQGEAVSMRVLWSVAGYRLGPQAGMSEQEAQSYLFKALDLTQDQICFDGRRCGIAGLQRQRVDPARYLPAAWQVTAEELGIGEPEIEVVRTGCSLPGLGEYLQLKGSRLVIQIQGVFFYLDPVRTQ